MACVVFLRAVNVGKHQRFSVAELSKKLANLDAVNIGAAGTIVVRKAISQQSLHDRVQKLIPFECEMMICRGSEIENLVDDAPFAKHEPGVGAKPFVSVMATTLQKPPPLPIAAPPG